MRLLVTVAAAVALWLAVVPCAHAQSTADLVGTYALTVSHSGTICPEESTGTLEVTSVTDSQISIVLNGGAGTFDFNAAQWQFSGAYGDTTVEGWFRPDADMINATIVITWPDQCVSTGVGSKPYAAGTGPETGPEVAESPGDEGLSPPIGADPPNEGEGADGSGGGGNKFAGLAAGVVLLGAAGGLAAYLNKKNKKKKKRPVDAVHLTHQMNQACGRIQHEVFNVDQANRGLESISEQMMQLAADMVAAHQAIEKLRVETYQARATTQMLSWATMLLAPMVSVRMGVGAIGANLATKHAQFQAGISGTAGLVSGLMGQGQFPGQDLGSVTVPHNFSIWNPGWPTRDPTGAAKKAIDEVNAWFAQGHDQVDKNFQSRKEQLEMSRREATSRKEAAEKALQQAKKDRAHLESIAKQHNIPVPPCQ